MTNGEKIKEIFTSMPINVSEDTVYCGKSKAYIGEFSKDWWNAEYKEPTTKNDLGVDKLISDCEKMSFDIEIFNKPLKVVALDAVKNIVKGMTLVIPIRPKGHWILTDVEGNKVWHCRCSECGKDPQDYIGGSEDWWLIKNNLPKFCPSCGSDNREVVKE